MFGDEVAISWSDFFANSGGDARVNDGPRPVSNKIDAPAPTTSDADVITTTSTAATTRNVSELQAQIQRNGGVLTVSPNASEYLVAINNRLRFQVTRNASGQFEIRESSYYMYAIGGALLLGVILLAKK